MRYIGNKRNLIDNILGFIYSNIKEPILDTGNLLDLYAGTGAVAYALKKRMPIITNDNLYLSYCLAHGSVIPNTAPDFGKLCLSLNTTDPIFYLNQLNDIDLTVGFIAKNYSALHSERLFFTEDNAKRIDSIRQLISSWHKNQLIDDVGNSYLIASLLKATCRVSNTTGSYSSHLKSLSANSYYRLYLEHPILIDNGHSNTAYCQDAIALLNTLKEHPTVCYLDPPYTKQQYSSNYHLLETIALGDEPVITGKTGIRKYDKPVKSSFCSVLKSEHALREVVSAIKSPHIVMSYTSKGVITQELIKEALSDEFGSNNVILHAYDYHTHKGGAVKKRRDDEQYLFYIKNEAGLSYKNSNRAKVVPKYHLNHSLKEPVHSPIAYHGNQFDVIEQIKEHMPSKIDTFYDVFAGSLTVSLNVDANKYVINDLHRVVLNMMKYLGSQNISVILREIDSLIDDYQLNRVDADNFLKLREHYNQEPNALKLYVLICHSYDCMFRFNSSLKYNNHFGKKRSSFSTSLKRKLMIYNSVMSNMSVAFSNERFDELLAGKIFNTDDVVYCHPPSFIQTRKMNAASRGVRLWTAPHLNKLLDMLTHLNKVNCKFMLVDTYKYKDLENTMLIDWSRRFKTQTLQIGDDKTDLIICNL